MLKLRNPVLIVTTGLALIYESVVNYIAGGVEQTLPSNLRAFGQMPWNIILALLACVAAYIFLKLYKDWYVYICDRQQRVRSEKHGYQC